MYSVQEKNSQKGDHVRALGHPSLFLVARMLF
jgi:hypothetical protein